MKWLIVGLLMMVMGCGTLGPDTPVIDPSIFDIKLEDYSEHYVDLPWEGEWEGARQVHLVLIGVVHPGWPEHREVRILAVTVDGKNWVQLTDAYAPPLPGENPPGE